MTFRGTIIEESLKDLSVLGDVKVVSTKVVPATERHKTPWVKQWTLHTVEVPQERVVEVTENIRRALDRQHNWYADYKSDKEHFIIYRDKVFHITDRSNKAQYDEATEHGIAVGIPDYQVDFSPHITQPEN